MSNEIVLLLAKNCYEADLRAKELGLKHYNYIAHPNCLRGIDLNRASIIKVGKYWENAMASEISDELQILEILRGE